MRFLKTLTFLILATGLAFVLPAWPQQKPLTQKQVSKMVQAGHGDASGAKMVQERGIGFAPTEDFLQSLKVASASEAFLKALRATQQIVPPQVMMPLQQIQILALLGGEVTSHRVTLLVNERGIDFKPRHRFLHEVRLGGGDDELITALEHATVRKPPRQAEIGKHVARGTAFCQKGMYAQAEQEYRAALRLDPQNADIYVGLAYVVYRQCKYPPAEPEALKTVSRSKRLGGVANPTSTVSGGLSPVSKSKVFIFSNRYPQLQNSDEWLYYFS
jgi:tetratricopeptide (TPR) repeat protein